MENAKALGEVLAGAGFDLVSGGTDTHLLLVDLRPKKLTGNVAEKALGRAHITVNKNSVPFDPEKPTVTSGIRIGSPAGTTRGFGIAEFQHIGRLMAEVLDGLAANGEAGNAKVEAKVKAEAIALYRALPDLRVRASHVVVRMGRAVSDERQHQRCDVGVGSALRSTQPTR